MKLSRLVAGRGAAVAAALAVALAAPPLAAGQTAPRLSRPQRATLEAVVAAVDRLAQAPETATAARWHTHRLRASDGSHYIAVRAVAGVAVPQGTVALYVRLAPRVEAGVTTQPPRSAVMEWLRGQRSDPLPMRAARSITVPQGELPIGGAAASAGDVAAESSNALRLLDHQREQAAREREARERQRRAELEDAARRPLRDLLPFEDFDVAARLDRDPAGVAVQRSVRAGPGQYDLFVAWAEPAANGREPAVYAIAHRLDLPPAGPELALSDLVLADAVSRLEQPYPPADQNAHPYALGALEAIPAPGDAFRVDQRLSVVFQVINPAGGTGGKPDVDVTFRVNRLAGNREEAVGTLPPQRYSAANLPVDFDVARGHPLFVAVQAPLARFARGRYRLTVTATDRVAGRRVDGAATFTVAGTPLSLLQEAPAPGQRFRREATLEPIVTGALARAFTPSSASPGLQRLLDATAAGRFADLVRDEPVEPGERAAAQALRTFGLFALGDTPRTVTPALQQALAQGAPPAPVLVMLGAAHALAGDDRAAIAAWQQARDAGIDEASVAALLVDGYVRQGDAPRAAAMARAALDAQPGNLAAARGLAATHIAGGRYAEALAVLDALPPAVRDADTDFLVLHALFGGLVGDTAPGRTAEGRERLRALGARYVAAEGRHAALVREWIAVADAMPQD